MKRFQATLFVLILLSTTTAPMATAYGDPDQTVRTARQVLREVMAIPARQIPERLLAEARGIAIIPNVIKIGFVAGVRRGHGVVLVRDQEGEWGLPQFVTLTGGSVGWQAGVQGTDVILVFTTDKSVEGLLSGKCTIGVDAAVAAGPVGRNAAAATDERLQAEILSYSRSRGLFLGLALDGSVIEVDSNSHLAYYGAAAGQLPRQIPESASQLLTDLAASTPGGSAVAIESGPAADLDNSPRLETLRHSLGNSVVGLNRILDRKWQSYLALPAEVFEGGHPPTAESLQISLQRYDRIAQSPQYKGLAARPEFQATYELLRDYTAGISQAAGGQLELPPPPAR